MKYLSGRLEKGAINFDGQVEYNGVDINEFGRHFHSGVGYVTQV